jgi:hypothetical protein
MGVLLDRYAEIRLTPGAPLEFYGRGIFAARNIPVDVPRGTSRWMYSHGKDNWHSACGCEQRRWPPAAVVAAPRPTRLAPGTARNGPVPAPSGTPPPARWHRTARSDGYAMACSA